MREKQFHRGDVFFVKSVFGKGLDGSSTARPALIVSNNRANEKSMNVNVVYLTLQPQEKEYPFHVKFGNETIQCETITSVQKSRLTTLKTVVPKDIMAKVDEAIKTHLQLNKGVE